MLIDRNSPSSFGTGGIGVGRNAPLIVGLRGIALYIIFKQRDIGQ